MTWRPIETAPKDGTLVLLHDPRAAKRRVKTGSWLPPEAGWAVYGFKDVHGCFFEPTHWQPLPAPPEDGE